ncbi:YheC/YheD family protein [Alkalihalobacillus sp. MEB130]|uniref:YheC/YheD family endospore coat-associated protein n=1 Tax=Alkalihalobacillus sp. MEB130 TaxID=2976704 RepID=UPI0028DDCC8E|nr:YheC/YheD family protein [Alkalihalobacillus sp. MEB130]MDT8861216.1 YheC/YheD family protein [Alkalihalobacillus sp. MEB130]
MATSDSIIIGVLVTNRVINKLMKGDHSMRGYDRLVQLSRAAKVANVTLYFFSAKNVFFSKAVKGMVMDEQGVWEKKLFPLPDVLYDRLATRDTKSLSEQIRREFDRKGIKKINSISYFNKGDVYTSLLKNEKVNKYLPESKWFSDEKELITFLKRHPKVYLKAARGGRGRSVLCIESIESNGYQYKYFRDDHLFTGEASDFHELFTFIQQFFKDRPFIMQKGINLLKIENSNIDFRAELQRNGEGNLGITGITARTGVKNSPITTHSSAYTLEQFFEKVLYYRPEEIYLIKDRFQTFLYDMYEAIEEIYGPFGEIGIDFGLDTNGDIWFIEPNAKSAKVSLYKAYDQETYFQAFLNPIEYAKFIMKSDPE